MKAFLLLFLSEILLLRQTSATTQRVPRQNMRVRISAAGDTIVFKFIQPHVDTRLEGYILGYGSSMFSKQFIHLPEDGQPYETEIDAEPKYLIAVQSKKPEEPKKQCTGKVDLEKPLHVVIGSVTQSSVLLSWGTLLTSPFMDSVVDDCIDEGQFTVRYREKEPSNTWNYQTCPSTSTVIDNLKPDALYEFAVRADTENNSGAWSPPVIHNTADQIIEPFKELNQAIPKEPVLAGQPSFLPPVSVLNNITQTRAPAPLLKHTGLPKQWKTSVSTIGAENTTTTPDDQPAFTEALSFTDTPIILPMPKTTNTVQPQNPTSHPSTTQPDPHTEQHTSLTPQQLMTTQPQPSTTQQQTSTTQPPPTTNQKYTTKTLKVKVQPYTAKQLPNTVQQQFSETTSSPSSSTTKPPLHQTQQHTTRTVQEHPYPSKKQDTITQHSLHTRKIQPGTKVHRLSTTQRSQGTSKHQTTHTYDFSKSTSHYQSSTITHSTTFTQPNNKPTATHSEQPNNKPTASLSKQPNNKPTATHSEQPNKKTTATLFEQPNNKPTATLSEQPNNKPTATLSEQPNNKPTASLTEQPNKPTATLSEQPNNKPTASLSEQPNNKPTASLSEQPNKPTATLSEQPNDKPTASLSEQPNKPTATLSEQPNDKPTATLSEQPNDKPTATLPEQPNNKPTTTQNWFTNVNSPTNTALNSPTTLANIQDGFVSWQTTNFIKQPIFSTKPSILVEDSTPHIPTTEDLPLTENVQELTPQPIYPPIRFWYQPQPSTTTQHSSTTKQQANTAKYNPKTYSHVENQPPNPEEQLPGTQKPLLNLTPKTAFIKSDAIHNSPVVEKVTVRTRQPGQPEGRGIFHNSSSLSRPLARNVTQRLRPHGRIPLIPPTKSFRPPSVYRNSTFNRKKVPHGERHIGLWAPKIPRKKPDKTKLNQVSETKEKEKFIDLKQMDPVPDWKPLPPPTTEKTTNQESSQTTTPQSAFEGSRFDTGDNSSVFSPHPLSEVDATGKKRFVAPHVIYRTDKRPEEPCSVTHSLSFFPDEEVGYINVTGPPKTPPSNLTVVTVEGCPSFVILDWDKTDNETTEYEVVSSTKGPHGEEVSIQTTNQTHTAVENLKPESSYEFKVVPKNELGSGPTSDPVSFSTESADPRVSEVPTGKNAIWSSFPFKADSYSECNGRQFIKRTWYRKFVGIQLCNSLRYKIYLSDSLKGKFYSIGDQTGYGEDHCQFVDSFLDGRTGGPLPPDQLPPRQGFFRAMRQEPVKFGDIGGNSMINYVAWYECGIPIPGKW
ncbi:target of Nesh-SH3 isoform X2 [Ctenopharyngodon idella]|uniref:target of Nesh-SH3 isoform X2 n=1 Tax=Ctenopharyngodon idella TaxID=7959 RepID=UPI0022314953|nr:target of Nesh-SH3 isoform X2 [Ctenopharyngodon idella]